MPVQIQPSELMKRLPAQFFSNLVARTNRRIQEGHDVINLGQGNPDLPTPPHIIKVLQQEGDNPRHHKYSPFTGYRELKEAIAKWYFTHHQVVLDPEKEVAILPGSKTGLVEISQCLLNQGDKALVPDPGYPDYWSGIAMAGATMVEMPLLAENQFLPDYTQLSPEQLRGAKLMFLNYPNNPTGAIASREFFAETIRFAEKHNILVAHDFAYGSVVFDNEESLSFLSLPGAKETGIEFGSLSKMYNMAGWRVGYAVGNEKAIELINTIQDHYYCSIFGAIQMASVEALSASQDCVKELTLTYEKRRNLLYAGLQDIGWEAPLSKGTFFCWLPVPRGFTSVSFSDFLLENADVVLAPGTGFGPSGEGYVRLALLTTEQRIQEFVNRIKALKIHF